jgi:membrane protein YdbS with pleckstrin-like domain
VDRDKPDQPPQRRRSPARRSRWDASGLLVLINGVLAGIAGVYVTTRSVPITMAAGGAALMLAALIVIVRR